MAVLDIQMLGGIRILHEAVNEIKLDTSPRLQTFFTYLVLHRGIAVSRAQVAYQLWPDSGDTQARANLRRLILHLRRVLPDVAQFVKLEGQTLLWHEDAPYTLDVAEFDKAVSQAEQFNTKGSHIEQQNTLERALALYRGDLLPGLYEDWLEPERERLRQRFTGVLEALVKLHEQRGDLRLSILYAERLVQHDPFLESSHRQLIELHGRNGERAKALHAYHHCISFLRRELSVEPARETVAVYEQLVQPPERSAPKPVTPSSSSFIGRNVELASLKEAWQHTLSEGSRVVLIGGESGIGKTRLLEEFLSSLGSQTLRTASARCYTAEGSLTYAPVVDLLRSEVLQGTLSTLEGIWATEVSRLVPEVLYERPEVPPPGPLAEAWQRQRLFEALARAVLAVQPLVITLDDLQWCDNDSLEWLRYLLRYAPQAPLLIVGTFRADEVHSGHPLTAFRTALEREGRLHTLELEPLDEAETHQVVSTLLGRELEVHALARLYQETEGHPLFIVEIVRANHLELRHSAQAAEGSHRLPPRMHAVITARLEQLSSAARELASMAALIGRRFTYSLLAQASEMDERVLISTLDELWRRRIVRELPNQKYDFTHDKLREVAQRNLSITRKRHLHRQIAAALEVLHAHDFGTVSGHIAFHFEHAELPERAIPYYRQAAEVSRQRFANEEAVAYYRRAIDLLEALTAQEPSSWQDKAGSQLYEELADVLKLTGHHEQAFMSYSRALEYASNASGLQQARLHRKRGLNHIPQRQYDAALESYALAEHALGHKPTEASVPWWQEWIDIQFGCLQTLYWLGRAREMDTVLKQLKPMVEKYGSALQQARIFRAIHGMVLRRDRYALSEELLDYARRALSAYKEVGSVTDVAVAHFHVGFSLLWGNELAEAHEQMQMALTLAERTGDAVLKLRSLVYLSVCYRKARDLTNTRIFAEQSLSEATTKNVPEYVALAKSNLAWLMWLDGDVRKMQEEALAALHLWQNHQPVFAFKWTALFPLLAAEYTQGMISEALHYAKALLEPKHQVLPAALSMALSEAITAGEHNDTKTAKAQLASALQLAEATHFL
jgi:DNA-binding SARP family transcriptional activator